jgi:uncharacterized Zn finger protein
MEKKKRKKYLKYPKILTVTCASCGAVTEVRLETKEEDRYRYYCSDKCRKAYQFQTRSHAPGVFVARPRIPTSLCCVLLRKMQ